MKTAQATRPEIIGPLSLFSNISGKSILTVGNRYVRVDDSTYFLTNQEQEYSLDIEEKTEIFNIHFGNRFVNDLYRSILINENDGIDYINDVKMPVHYNQLLSRGAVMNRIICELYNANRRQEKNQLFRDELLVNLFYSLHQTYERIQKTISRLPGQKASTRQETYKRIGLAVDFMHSHYELDLGLEELSKISCLSKFYFIKGFKSVHHCTPYQYLLEIRLSKARQLLRASDLSVGEIAESIGFDYLSSFSRAFYKKYAYYPSSGRERVIA